jgi:hypothetical protein
MDAVPALLNRLSHRQRAALALLAATALTSACMVVPLEPQRVGGPTSPSPIVISPALPASPQLLQVRLYPLNAEANRAGVLAASVLDQQDGRGRFTIAYQGRNLQGEASRVAADHPGFGQLLGAQPDAASRPTTRRGIANAAGPGLNAQCEYLLSGPAQGTGICQFSDGARYQMHFSP